MAFEQPGAQPPVEGQPVPPEAAAAEGAPSQGPEAGGARQLVTDISERMTLLQQGLQDSGMAQESEQLAQLKSAFDGLVEQLGSSPGGQQPADQGVTTPEAGAQDVQPVV